MATPEGFLSPQSKDWLDLAKTLLIPVVMWVAKEMRSLTVHMTKLLTWKEDHQKEADRAYDQLVSDIDTLRKEHHDQVIRPPNRRSR